MEAAFSAVLETFDGVIYFEAADLFFKEEQTARQHGHFHSFNIYVIKELCILSNFKEINLLVDAKPETLLILCLQFICVKFDRS